MAASSYLSHRPWWRSDENPRDPGLRPSESFAPIAAAKLRNSEPRLPNSNRYRARAEDCRAMAKRLIDPKRRQQMLDLAETYEKAAIYLDRLYASQSAVSRSINHGIAQPTDAPCAERNA